MLVQPRPQLFHGAGAIFMLRPFILALHYDAGRKVRKSYRRFRPVDVLSPRAAGPEHVDPNILGLDVYVDLLVHLRIDKHRREGRVSPGVGIEWRDPYQPMHPNLGLQHAVSVLSVDLEGGGFDPGAVPLQAIGDHRLHVVPFRPAQVHPQQHLRPILTLGSAGARMDSDNGVLGIVFARQQHAVFELFQACRERLHLALNLARDILALARELEQRIQIGCQGPDLRFVSQRFLQPFPVLHHLLTFFRLIPEVRIVDL